MKKFTDWLNHNPGMATRLHKELGVNPTNISNWRHERKHIPWRWMEIIDKLSKGSVPLKEMMDYRRTTVLKS